MVQRSQNQRIQIQYHRHIVHRERVRVQFDIFLGAAAARAVDDAPEVFVAYVVLIERGVADVDRVPEEVQVGRATDRRWMYHGVHFEIVPRRRNRRRPPPPRVGGRGTTMIVVREVRGMSQHRRALQHEIRRLGLAIPSPPRSLVVPASGDGNHVRDRRTTLRRRRQCRRCKERRRRAEEMIAEIGRRRIK
jgi:hypothetical protein